MILHKAEPGAADQCQSSLRTRQCENKAIEGSIYCMRHGGWAVEKQKTQASKRMYDLAQWQTQVDNFADEDEVKSLRAEIGITRLLLERVMTSCKTDSTMLLMSSKITDIVLKIEKLVSSCHRLEAASGNHLDKSKVFTLATQIVDIIGKHIEDGDILDDIATEISALFLKQIGE